MTNSRLLKNESRSMASKKILQGNAQIPTNKEYLYVCRGDEGCRTTQHPDFLRSRQGYTLIELAVVVLLISIVLMISVPKVRDTMLGDDLQSVETYLVAATKQLRADAVREQIDYVLQLDFNDNSCWTYSTDMTPEKKYERKKNAYRFPPGVAVTDIILSGEDKRSMGEVNIQFFKGGYVQSAVIHLSKEDKVATIVLNAFINRINTYDRYVTTP
jgi:prepilin-type N-terminal cleavage/methylation domain-containing protein